MEVLIGVERLQLSPLPRVFVGMRRAAAEARSGPATFVHAIAASPYRAQADRVVPVGREGRPVGNFGPVPWITYSAIDWLDQVVAEDAQVLEIGAGYSTLWWAGRGNTVVSLETDRHWITEIESRSSEMGLDHAVSIQQVDSVAAVDAQLSDRGDSFDVVVVDGIEPRGDVALACLHTLREDGVLVFDNSDRAAYSGALEALEHQGYVRLDFFGLVPVNGHAAMTSTFFRQPPRISGRRGRFSTVDY